MRVPTRIRVNQASGWWGSNQTAAFERLTATIAKWRKDRSREPQPHVQMLFIMTQSQLDTELYQLSNTGRLPFITRRRRRECTCRRLSWQVSLSMRHGVKSVLPPGESIWLYACSCSWPGIISEVCPNFFAVARFSFGGGGVAIRYVLPVLWMTSCAPTISQTKATQVVRSVEVGRTWRILTRGQHRTGAESDIYDCLVAFCMSMNICLLSIRCFLSNLFITIMARVCICLKIHDFDRHALKISRSRWRKVVAVSYVPALSTIGTHIPIALRHATVVRADVSRPTGQNYSVN